MQEPFFIVGCPRSGTTLLSVLIDRHSRLCVPPETGFYDEIAPALSRGDDAKLLQLLATWRRLPELGLTPEQVRARLRHETATPGHVLAAILDLHAEVRGKARSGEKTPQHLMHVPSILRDFPDARIVCIVRDGRDNALSLRAMPWWSGTLRGAARLWAKYARLASRFADQHPRQFLVVRYEDLLADSERTLTRITTHLGESFEPAQLDASLTSATVLPRSMQWKGQALQPIDAAEAGRRRAAASARDLATIEAVANRELQLHGYATSTRPSAMARFFRRR